MYGLTGSAWSLRLLVPPTFASSFEWVGFVVRRPDVLGAISPFAVLLGGAIAPLPIFAGGILHAGPMGLGLLRAAPRGRRTFRRAWPVASAVGAASRAFHVPGGRRHAIAWCARRPQTPFYYCSETCIGTEQVGRIDGSASLAQQSPAAQR